MTTSIVPTVSFEFFPPNTEAGLIRLKSVAKELSAVKPEFFSVTYGAGGATQQKTLDAVRMLVEQGHKVVPHVSCVGATEPVMHDLLKQYIDLGLTHIVALRGDLPSGMLMGGAFPYALDLVKFVRKHYGDGIFIEVAAYPEVHPTALDAKADLVAFCNKLKAGANSAITQFFYNSDAYSYFVQSVRELGFDQPIIPGIMPIQKFANVLRFAQNSGAEVPRWLCKQMQTLGDDSVAIEALGTRVVTQLCHQLVTIGVPSIHFYTLNQVEPSLQMASAVLSRSVK
jgi:methylenetetrahydrofolate reductase (NADPH)